MEEALSKQTSPPNNSRIKNKSEYISRIFARIFLMHLDKKPCFQILQLAEAIKMFY